MKTVIATVAVVLLVSASAHAVVLLADFDAAGTGDTMPAYTADIYYPAVATASTKTVWSSKAGGKNGGWDVVANPGDASDGWLKNTYASNQTNFAGAVFRVDLSSPTDGKVWAIQFTVIDGGRASLDGGSTYSGLNDIDVLLGKDDGDNTTEKVIQLKSGTPVGQSGVVENNEWNQVLNDGYVWQSAADNETITAPFHYRANGGAQGILKNLNSYDLLCFQIQSNSKAGNETILDNVKLVEVAPMGDFNGDGKYDLDDVDALTGLGDLTAPGVSGVEAKYDIAGSYMDATSIATGTRTASTTDLNAWLYWAARGNSTYGAGGAAYYTPYKAGDSDLNRTVDINDALRLVGNYDGGAATDKVFSQGDTNGDGSVDVDDVTALKAAFDGGLGYNAAGEGGSSTPPAPPPGDGKVKLVVETDTGHIKLVANAASIAAFQITSPGGGLIVGDALADVLAEVLGNTTRTYGELALANTALNGQYVLELGFNTTMDLKDIAFSYGQAGQTAVQGDVVYTIGVPDANNDGVLDAADFMMIKQNFGKAASAIGQDGDLNKNGQVDWADLNLLMQNIGSGGTSPSVPEPATLFIMMAAGLPALLKRRRLVRA